MSFEFFSILSTVALSIHVITAWIMQKFIQLVNFETFRVWLNLYERALLEKELFC